jgi:hypothetical protein
MAKAYRLTSKRACRVAGIDHDRLNEHAAAGRYPCAPSTIRGRTRVFDPDDMLALVLFTVLLEDGFAASKAGPIACEVAAAARQHPEARAISYVRSNAVKSGFTVDGAALPASSLPDPESWNKQLFGDVDLIERTMTFNVWQYRERIAKRTEEEALIIGEED